MLINLIWDATVASAPADFQAEIQAAADFFEAQYTDPITINIAVGYGEVNGQPISQGAQSRAWGIDATYSETRTAFAADATSYSDAIAVSSLPSSDPTGGKTIFLTNAQAKALDLQPANTQFDGAIGLSASQSLAPSSIVIAAAEHEISEVMGRFSELAFSPNFATIEDLFRYSAPGVRDLTGVPGNGTAYFSLDGGTTNLHYFNTTAPYDLGGWNSATAGNDAFDENPFPAGPAPVTSVDLTLMDILGYDQAPASVANTAMPAVAVEASMYGAVGSAAEILKLETAFLPAQVATAVQNGYNPQVYAAEALGTVFAFANETGSIGFANNFGPSKSGMANSVAGDQAFANAAVTAIFSSAATTNLDNVMQQFVSNWKVFFTTNGVAGIASATPDQIDLAARGASWGDMVGIALANNLGLLSSEVSSFLEDAAQGTAIYGASLIGQPAHAAFA